MDCFERCPKGWDFSRASMPVSRISFCSWLASRNMVEWRLAGKPSAPLKLKDLMLYFPLSGRGR